MLLTVFLAIIFCVAITLMMFSAVAFIQNTKFFSSAPKEAKEALIPREKELFYGARAIGWVLMIFSFLMIPGPVRSVSSSESSSAPVKRYIIWMPPVSSFPEEFH